VGDVFPNLNGLYTISTKDDGIRTLPGFNYYDYLADCNGDEKVSSASWGIMLVFPGRTFSQVCISELKALSKLSAEFRKAKVKVCGFTANPRDTNRAWIEEVESTGDNDDGECTTVDFPIFCDNTTFDNAVEMGTLDEEKTSEYDVPILYRSTFIIRPDRTIAMTFQQASNVGRDFKCILEFVESLQKGYNAAGSGEGGSSADELVLSSC